MAGARAVHYMSTYMILDAVAVSLKCQADIIDSSSSMKSWSSCVRAMLLCKGYPL
jgi:hypothetical protein